MNIINASKWVLLTYNNLEVYSPTPSVINQVDVFISNKLWEDCQLELACLIIDKQNQEIIAIRDKFGFEPFFYTIEYNNFIFGSNLPDLVRFMQCQPVVSDSYVLKNLIAACYSFSEYSDQTQFKNVFRIEPGTISKISNSNNSVTKEKYWDLNNQPIIQYKSNDEYLEHFTALFHEGVVLCSDKTNNLAAEFSGGLDSTAVVVALNGLKQKFTSYLHVAPLNGDQVDDSEYVKLIAKQLHLSNINFIDAEDFDLCTTLELMRDLFAGMPYYFFPIGANNIHQAIAAHQHQIVMSGFGGDECVSSHANLALFLREQLGKQQFSKAWRELNKHFEVSGKFKPSLSNRLFTLLKCYFPSFTDYLKENQTKKSFGKYYEIMGLNKFNTIKEQEISQLQGNSSLHIRLRIEESAIIAKHYGFKYRYPLLYPKLIEFCNNIPLVMKRSNGENRIMIRNYLAQFLLNNMYDKHQKVGGIMPSTIAKISQEYESGKYDNIFINTKYQNNANEIANIQHVSNFSKILQRIILHGVSYS